MHRTANASQPLPSQPEHVPMHGQRIKTFADVCRKQVLAGISLLLRNKHLLRCISETAALALFIVATNIEAGIGMVQGHRR